MTASAPAAPRWVDLLAVDEIPEHGLRPVLHEGVSVLLARGDDGEVFAVEARCPHEGYPLATGALDGCTLTCSWHNWKFDLRDGACVLGGEGLRTYPVRVVAGRVEVDVAEPDASARVPALLESFHEGLARGEEGRTVRDGVRLLAAGYDPARLLAEIARRDALHAEYGTTHVLPVAADGARMLARHRGPDAMLAIAPALDLCVERHVRREPRPRAAPIGGATADALLQALECEDAARAEGLLRGAFADEVPLDEILRWLHAACTVHFTDFGHQLIYLVKLEELLRSLPDPAEYAEDLLAGLVVGLVLATREDTLPYMQRYARRLAEAEPELAAWHAGARDDAPFDAAAVRDAVLDGTHTEAIDVVEHALGAGVAAPRVARAIVAAAAHRWLRFDVALDADPDVAENWLWVTHRFTYASAVRVAVERFEDPRALRLLYHAVAFVHSGRPMDLATDARTPADARTPTDPAAAADCVPAADPVPAVDRVRAADPVPAADRVPAADPVPTADPADVVAAIAARDVDLAVGRAAAWLASDRPVEPLAHALEDLALSDPVVRPIVVAHVIKTTVAAFEERAALGPAEDHDVPVLALVRMLASPVVERRVRELVLTSIRWVVDREMPRKLTQ